LRNSSSPTLSKTNTVDVPAVPKTFPFQSQNSISSFQNGSNPDYVNTRLAEMLQSFKGKCNRTEKLSSFLMADNSRIVLKGI
jgi:hypothetical protein